MNNKFENPPVFPGLTKIINTCPLCESRIFKQFATVCYAQGYVQYLKCNNCGFVFQSPQMDENAQRKFYGDNYRIFEFGQAEPPKIDIDIQNKRAKHLVSLLNPYIRQLNGKVHLDIGCGLGILLKEINRAFGTISAGIEPDNAYRNYTITHQSLPTFSSIEEWQNSTYTSAFIVTMSHVLEHLPDPIKYLTFIRTDVLDKDGYLLIEVPNLFFHPSFELPHVSAFSPHTLMESLNKSGYRILSYQYHGVPSWITPRYITVIAQPCEKRLVEIYRVIPEPHGVAIKRSFGINISRFEDSIYRLLHLTRRIIKRF
jgi:2-polyprenyl-3-methyl-5-hydroxy-6-metoxy-1,4-benzoquinol methylase